MNEVFPSGVLLTPQFLKGIVNKELDVNKESTMWTVDRMDGDKLVHFGKNITRQRQDKTWWYRINIIIVFWIHESLSEGYWFESWSLQEFFMGLGRREMGSDREGMENVVMRRDERFKWNQEDGGNDSEVRKIYGRTEGETSPHCLVLSKCSSYANNQYVVPIPVVVMHSPLPS